MSKEAKIDLFIVEGSSDESYLNPIKKIISKKNDLVRVKITHGDITSLIRKNYKAQFLDILREQVDLYLKETSLNITDIRQIIHVVDTDAVSCDSSKVIYNERADKIIYYNDKMETNKVKATLIRNKNKKEVLSIMYSITHNISFPKYNEVEIPYKMYYVSQNADHLFVNRVNLTDEEKEDESLYIADLYSNDFDGYLELINNNIFNELDYKNSWIEILKPENAFLRKTNLNILIQKYIDEGLI